MNKKTLFTLAWTKAKRAAKRFGGKASEYLAESLRQAWKAIKALTPQVTPKKPVEAVTDTFSAMVSQLPKRNNKPRKSNGHRYARSQCHLNPMSKFVGYKSV